LLLACAPSDLVALLNATIYFEALLCCGELQDRNICSLFLQVSRYVRHNGSFCGFRNKIGRVPRLYTRFGSKEKSGYLLGSY